MGFRGILIACPALDMVYERMSIMILTDLYGPIYRNLVFPFYDSVLRRRTTWSHYREITSLPWAPADELEKMRKERLRRLIEYCGARVPFYRNLFREKGLDLSRGIEDVRVLADKGITVTKENLREKPDEFISDDYRKEDLVCNWTSGSTGVPTDLYKTMDTWCMRMAIKMRSEDWIGKRPGTPSAMIWGQKAHLGPMARIKQQLYWNFQNYRFLPSIDLKENVLTGYISKIKRYGARYIESYVYPVYLMAEIIEKNGIEPPRLDGIVTGAEKLLDFQKEKIESVFGCPVYNRYGTSELTNISCECEQHDGQHINIDTLWVETVNDDDDPVLNEEGEVVVTDLMNYAMPLIRYRTDDIAVMSDRRCDCGRTFPMFETVLGKGLQNIKAPDGHEWHWKILQWNLYGVEGVFRYQFVERADDHFEIRIVPTGEVGLEEIREKILKSFSEMTLHGITLTVEFVEDIPLGGRGKMNFYISEKEGEA